MYYTLGLSKAGRQNDLDVIEVYILLPGNNSLGIIVILCRN